MPDIIATPATGANTAAFSVNEKGQESGETFSGLFKAKTKLSFADALIRDQRRRELLGPAPGTPDKDVLEMAIVFSELHVRLVEVPSWWSGHRDGLDLLQDNNVVMAVYANALKVQQDARDALKSAADQAKKDLKQEG